MIERKKAKERKRAYSDTEKHTGGFYLTMKLLGVTFHMLLQLGRKEKFGVTMIALPRSLAQIVFHGLVNLKVQDII